MYSDPDWAACFFSKRHKPERPPDERSPYIGHFEPAAALDKDNLYQMVRAAAVDGVDDEYDIHERVDALNAFYEESTAFAKFRREILSRFDPGGGLYRWSGIVWHADGVTAFFEGYTDGQIEQARAAFYQILFDDDRWAAVVDDCAVDLCRCQDKRPGLLTSPGVGLRLWQLLSQKDALRLRAVCRYTKRMYDTWIPILFPKQKTENAQAKGEK